MIKALILDLDDTIFQTSSIDPNLVKPFFDKLKEINDVLTENDYQKAKEELYKKPFKQVAEEYQFSERMIIESLEVLMNIEFKLSIKPFEDYKHIRNISMSKILVTTGIRKFQLAKIEALGISNDFKEIFIDDPMIEAGGKLKVFKLILEKYDYLPHQLLVIGDNTENEIKVGKGCGMHTLTINRDQRPTKNSTEEVYDFSEVSSRIQALNTSQQS